MKLRIVLRSYNKKAIESASLIFLEFLKANNCRTSGIIALPTRIKRYCVLRSPHIDKDSREHLELRISKRFFDIYEITPSILDLLFKLPIPPGVFCSLKEQASQGNFTNQKEIAQNYPISEEN